jgi:hypothetical protein
MKNNIKLKNLLFEMFYSESCPIDLNKKKKRETIKKEINSNMNIGNFTGENKKLFKIFFRHFDKNDFSIVNFMQNESKSISLDEEYELDKPETKSKFSFLWGSKILIEEKSSFFNKYITSIFQFIREFDILDEVNLLIIYLI